MKSYILSTSALNSTRWIRGRLAIAFLIACIFFSASSARADYIYTFSFSPNFMTAAAELSFHSPTLFTGTLSLTAAQADLVVAPLPDAVILSDSYPFWISADRSALVVTIGRPDLNMVFQFEALLAPLTAVGTYPFLAATVANHATGAEAAVSGQAGITQVPGSFLVPEPGSARLFGLIFVAVCYVRCKKWRKFLLDLRVERNQRCVTSSPHRHLFFISLE